jgi:hypothetical protein
MAMSIESIRVAVDFGEASARAVAIGGAIAGHSASVPAPRSAAWTLNDGEGWRYCTVLILFVPELNEGASL